MWFANKKWHISIAENRLSFCQNDAIEYGGGDIKRMKDFENFSMKIHLMK